MAVMTQEYIKDYNNIAPSSYSFCTCGYEIDLDVEFLHEADNKVYFCPECGRFLIASYEGDYSVRMYQIEFVIGLALTLNKLEL